MLNRVLIAGFAVLCSAVPGWAQSLSEIRIGPAVTGMELTMGVLPQPNTFNIANLESAQVDVLFNLPDEWVFSWLSRPRLELGGTISLAGRESSVHAALNWQAPLFDGPFFVETSIGVGVHNGHASNQAPPLRNLGDCNLGVHYAYGIGAHVGDNMTVTARFQHLSHAYLCTGPNEGLNSLALVAGYRF